MPRSVVAAAVVVDLASYYAAYVLCLAGALTYMAVHGEGSAIIVLAAIVFGLFAVALSLTILALSGSGALALPRWLSRLRYVRGILGFLEVADPTVTRTPRVLLEAGAYQIAIMLFDAATIWVLIRSLGANATPGGVFASFMISSLLRTIGVVPGGLGIFEATSVLTLKLVGVAIPVALSATLLFRGLSFWLPLLPGLWLSRRAVSGEAEHAHFTETDHYWTLEADALLHSLESGPAGLSSAEAAERLRRYGPNELREQVRLSRVRILWSQVRNPLLMLLLFAVVISALTGEWSDAAIVLTIVIVSVGIGYLPFAGALGFTPLPGTLLLALAAITVVYFAAAELMKTWFYRSAS
jgi:Mg2+-importing ATPase